MAQMKRRSPTPIQKTRKKEIIEAAIKVFLEKGYRNTTMEDIIRQTTLSKGGFYYYYGSTRDIFIDIMAEGRFFHLEEMIEGCRRITNPSVEDHLLFVTDFLTDQLFRTVKGMDLLTMFFLEIPNDKIYLKFFHRALSRAVKKIIAFMLEEHPGLVEAEISSSKIFFLGELLNGLSLSMRLFNAGESFTTHKRYIRTMFLDILTDAFGKPGA